MGARRKGQRRQPMVSGETVTTRKGIDSDAFRERRLAPATAQTQKVGQTQRYFMKKY